jgi:hypothetical protein
MAILDLTAASLTVFLVVTEEVLELLELTDETDELRSTTLL